MSLCVRLCLWFCFILGLLVVFSEEVFYCLEHKQCISPWSKMSSGGNNHEKMDSEKSRITKKFGKSF